MFLTSTETISGHEVIQTLGIVRGSSVRAKWFGSDFMAHLKNLVGGELEQYVKLMNEARETAISRMTADAEKLGANAIIGIRFTTSQIAQGAAEIMVFGTAVKVQ
ncbi:YbjQ family protein [Candidatus Woesearchaeota archaeon]|nr:YbjQ family protein [Candidatus Woesearchaeota archaeon]